MLPSSRHAGLAKVWQGVCSAITRVFALFAKKNRKRQSYTTTIIGSPLAQVRIYPHLAQVRRWRRHAGMAKVRKGVCAATIKEPCIKEKEKGPTGAYILSLGEGWGEATTTKVKSVSKKEKQNYFRVDYLPCHQKRRIGSIRNYRFKTNTKVKLYLGQPFPPHLALL